MDNTKLSKALKYTGLFIFGYLLLLSLSYDVSVYQPIATLCVGIFIWFGANHISFLNKKYGNRRILLVILLIGGAIRFLWAVLVPTLPISDFQFFHENAIKLSQGTAIVSKYMGYNLLLSVGYRIYPDVVTGKIINATASTLSILLIYLVGSKFIDEKTGLVAAFLFAILPSEINMVSVLATEVIATALVLATAFFLSRVTNDNLNNSTLQGFFAGLFFGLGITVRFSILFYLPVIMFIFFISFPSIKQKVNFSGMFLIGVTAGLVVLITSYWLITGYISLEPLKSPDSNLGLITGTNLETSGTWNIDDADLYYSWPASERNRLVINETLKRIVSKPTKFLLLIPRKFFVLMAPNDYGNAWSLYAVDWGEGNFWGIHAPPGGKTLEKYKSLQSRMISLNGMLSQAVYVFIWLFAFYAFKIFCSNRTSGTSRSRAISLIALALVFVTLLPHVILEVQSRYHHTLMPFIILFAACGIQQKITQAETSLSEI